jgi:hypothetical protein
MSWPLRLWFFLPLFMISEWQVSSWAQTTADEIPLLAGEWDVKGKKTRIIIETNHGVWHSWLGRGDIKWDNSEYYNISYRERSMVCHYSVRHYSANEIWFLSAENTDPQECDLGQLVPSRASKVDEDCLLGWAQLKDSTDLTLLENFRVRYGASNADCKALAGRRIAELMSSQAPDALAKTPDKIPHLQPEGDTALVKPPTPRSDQTAKAATIPISPKPGKAWLGVQVQNVDATMASAIGMPSARGALVAKILPDGPAGRSELKEGDVILAANDREVGTSSDFATIIGESSPGDTFRFRIYRQQKELDLNLTLGSAAAPSDLLSRQAAINPRAEQETSAIAKFTLRHNRDIYGHDIPFPKGKIAGVDIKGCAAECDKLQACVAFSYDRWNSICFLKNEIAASLLDVRSTIAVKKPAELPGKSGKKAEMLAMHEFRFRGDMTSANGALDLGACRSSCYNDMNCIGFTFVKGVKIGNCQKYKELHGYDRDAQTESGYKYQSP